MTENTKTQKWKSRTGLILLILLCQAVGAGGAVFTAGSVDTWYADLTKPFFNPPGWIFGPVWTVLYVMMAAAFWFVLRVPAVDLTDRRRAVFLFAFQLSANAVWSPLFFGLRRPDWAFADIMLLWVLIGLTLRVFFRISKSAGWLMVPYFAWVSFAAVLNFSLWQLNRF